MTLHPKQELEASPRTQNQVRLENIRHALQKSERDTHTHMHTQRGNTQSAWLPYRRARPLLVTALSSITSPPQSKQSTLVANTSPCDGERAQLHACVPELRPELCPGASVLCNNQPNTMALDCGPPRYRWIQVLPTRVLMPVARKNQCVSLLLQMVGKICCLPPRLCRAMQQLCIDWSFNCSAAPAAASMLSAIASAAAVSS